MTERNKGDIIMEKKVKYTLVQYKYVKHNTKQYEFSQIILIYGSGWRGKRKREILRMEV